MDPALLYAPERTHTNALEAARTLTPLQRTALLLVYNNGECEYPGTKKKGPRLGDALVELMPARESDPYLSQSAEANRIFGQLEVLQYVKTKGTFVGFDYVTVSGKLQPLGKHVVGVLASLARR